MRLGSLTCTLWGFPGDPPVADLLAAYGLLLVLALSSVKLLVSRTRGRISPRWTRSITLLHRVSASTLALALGLFLVGLVGLVGRHVGSWRPVRQALLEELARIERGHRRPGALSMDEYSEISRRLQSQDRRFAVSGCGESARIRILQTEHPFIGLNFGDGRNVVFEPRTMIVLYSD